VSFQDKISSADWNTRWRFAREQAHREHGHRPVAKLWEIRAQALLVRDDSPEWGGLVVGLMDLIERQQTPAC